MIDSGTKEERERRTEEDRQAKTESGVDSKVASITQIQVYTT